MLAPFMPTFLEANVGVRQTDLKFMYLCGGLTTLVTLPFFGRIADRFGKLPVFQILAVFALVPIILVTNLPTWLPLPIVLVVTTLYMVVMSGRMVPAMALVTASSAPAYRGSFMSLNAAVQQLAAGLATSISGFLIYEAQGGTLPVLGASTTGLLASPQGQGPLLAASSLYPGRPGALVGYWLVGLLACAASLASVVLAARLRKAAGGELAPDSRQLASPAHDGEPPPSPSSRSERSLSTGTPSIHAKE
jgi:MFS family permease